MKALSTYLKIFSVILLFISCSKELSLEQAALVPVDNTTQWSFEDSAGKRQGSVDTAFIAAQGDIEALFLEGTTNDDRESIFLQVIGQPLTTGNYSNEQVGFAYYIDGQQVYFNDPSAGEFTISITTLDTANIAGTFQGVVVNPRTGVASIQNGMFKARISSVPVGGTSVGEIICDEITTGGTFESGKETNATHFVEMSVDVTEPGTFVISSNLVNGLIFAGEGEFPAAGSYTLQIGAVGTPTESGVFEYQLTYGAQTCTFEVNVGGVSDSLTEPPPGALKAEEKLPGGITREDFLYYSGNKLIGQINSNVNPQRRIKYDSQNKLNSIEIWTPDGLGGFSLGYIAKFNYNGNGLVSSIVRTDANGNVEDTMKTYLYDNNDKVIQKIHFQGGSPFIRNVYEYTAGNLTKLKYTDASLTNFVDSISFSYDSRINQFKELHPQFYYISMTNLYNASIYSEALYFSNNYPTSRKLSNGNDEAVEVVINPSLKPIEVKVNGVSDFKWFF